jgi:hypothetical protein
MYQRAMTAKKPGHIKLHCSDAGLDAIMNNRGSIERRSIIRGFNFIFDGKCGIMNKSKFEDEDRAIIEKSKDGIVSYARLCCGEMFQYEVKTTVHS